MKDLLVVQAKVVLKTTSIAPIRNFTPPAVVVLGEDLHLTKEILYNNVEVTEFVISSPSRLIVRIPTSQVGKELTSLQALTTSTISRQDSLLSMAIVRPLRTVQGIDKLVQQFTLAMLTTPGSDIFEPYSGGGARAIIGRSANGNDSPAALLSLAVDRTKQQVFRSQAKNSHIPPSERLLSATLSSVEFDAENTAIRGVVDLRSVAGEGALVTVR
jgi:hypothetical protein